MTERQLARLAAEVDSLRTAVSDRVERDSLLGRLAEREGDILVGLGTEVLRDIATWAARGYFNDVRLHLRPEAVVEESDDVDVRLGPIPVRAGSWHLRVTIQRVEATLSLDSIHLAVADSSTLAAALAIGVSDATGDAGIVFRWDATTVASVVCRDFEVSESFGGTVPPFVYRVEGAFAFEARPDGIHALPRFEHPRLRVHPEPIDASWRRVEDLLDRQNNIFRCGLALQPDDMIEKLDRLLRSGFEFRLPDVLFRPIRLPARIEERVEIDRRPIDVRNVPVGVHMTPEAIWYGSTLTLEG